MSDGECSLLGIDIDADDYAFATAGDNPTLSRTFQSEADFQAQKKAYAPKVHDGNNYAALLEAVPALKRDAHSGDNHDASNQIKGTLRKKDLQLLGYAVGELYYDRLYGRVIELCERVGSTCIVEEKLSVNLEKWSSRCRQRLLDETGL